MAVRTFTTAGVNNLWSNAANWDTPPGDTDSAVIPLGQTCIYDMDNSAWATGLAGLTITGTLRFITNGTVTYLKMAGHISGAGTLYVGNSTVDIIPAPIPPAITTATIMFNGAFAFTMTGPAYFYGEERQTWALLSANAASGDSVIVLDRDMALRAGDLLGIGRNTNLNVATAHTALSYVAGTKTVTLTAPIGTQNRIIGDVVVCRTKSITVTGTTNTAKFTDYPNSSNAFRGVRWLSCQFVQNRGPLGLTLVACAIDTTYGITGYGAFLNNCAFYTSAGTYYLTASCVTAVVIMNCAMLNGTHISSANYILRVVNSVWQNNDYGPFACIEANVCGCIGRNTITADIYAPNGNIVLHRTLLSSSVPIVHSSSRPELHLVQSFDHGQVANAYRAWMLGGIIVSDTTTKPTGHLQSLNFQLASATYRMRRDYTFWIENGQSVSITIPSRKDFAGGTMPVVKLFDADYPDLWLDAVNCVILASDTMTDVVDTWDDLLISYTATERKQVTLRMEAIGATGNVYFSPENVEKLLSGGGGISRSRIIGGV